MHSFFVNRFCHYYKNIQGCLFSILLFLFVSHAVAGVEPLTVSGNKVLKGGKVHSMAGMSSYWSNTGWGGEAFYNADIVAWLKQDWNIELIRASMGVEDDGGYYQDKAGNKARIISIIEAAIANDIYVIVDWHSHYAHTHGNAITGWPEAEAFFKEIAQSYGHHNNIIYETYNEPSTPATWAEIKAYTEAVIQTIRQYDPDNLILAGNPTWSQQPQLACADPITSTINLAYAFHFYAPNHTAENRASAQQALDMGCALFATEYGVVDYQGIGEVDTVESELWYRFMADNGISHAMWNITDWNGTMAILAPGASPLGGWSDSDLSATGLYAKSMISQWALDSDNDGLNDALDRCDDTPSDHEIMPDGCSIINGTQQIIQSSSNKCIEVSEAGTNNGNNVNLWSCSGSAHHLWHFTYLGNNDYEIVNSQSNLLLNVAGGGSSNNIQQWGTAPSWDNSQRWRVENQGNGEVVLRALSDVSECIVSGSYSGADGANIHTWPCDTNTAAMRFKLITQESDLDEDGVADNIDECELTPTGAYVDETGCPIDNDGDSVFDGIDQCDATPANALVNITGCADSQLDDDNDGYTNDIDNCDNTPIHSLIDNNGCAIALENLSFGKQASVDSLYSASFPASFAVNGNTNDFAHNNSGVNGWWQLDLGQVYRLAYSEWYNRTDCCSDRMNNYSIEGSLDGSEWFTFSLQNQQMAYPSQISMQANARYVRLVQHNNANINFAEVNIYGALLADADADGIADSDDDCSETPTGASVDNTGCPFDSDGDAVLDGIDQCNNTPITEIALVNGEGCSASERDTDKDGIKDNIDNCDNTPPNAYVDEFGCALNLQNVALNKPATQSSTWGTLVASKAVDGNTNGNNPNLAHSNGADESGIWWQVDLGQAYQIAHSHWYNRTDSCCTTSMGNYSIYGSLDGINWDLLNTQTSHMASPSVINLNTVARFIRLKQNSGNNFNFAEVEIFASESNAAHNVALGKLAYMDSNYIDKQFPANDALDGKLNNFAHNFSGVGGWWQLDLGQVYFLTDSYWYNRIDCCSERMDNYTVQYSVDGINWFVASNESTEMARPSTINVNAEARYLRLLQNNEAVINFAEVIVMGSSIN